jgi:hypothetical protein
MPGTACRNEGKESSVNMIREWSVKGGESPGKFGECKAYNEGS